MSRAYLPFVLLVLPTLLLEFALVKDNGGAIVSSSWGLAFGTLGLRQGDGVEREGGNLPRPAPPSLALLLTCSTRHFWYEQVLGIDF